MKYACKSLLGGALYMRIDQSLFTPIDADLVKCSLFSVLCRDLTLSALHFVALFSSSNLPSAENVIAFTVTCHFIFISTDDKAFIFSILLHTWVFSTDLFCH